MIYRIFVEKKENLQAKKIREESGNAARDRRGGPARDPALRRGGDQRGRAGRRHRQRLFRTARRQRLPRGIPRRKGLQGLCDRLSGRTVRPARRQRGAVRSAAHTEKQASHQMRPRVCCQRCRRMRSWKKSKNTSSTPLESSEVSPGKTRNARARKNGNARRSGSDGFYRYVVNDIAQYHKKNGFAMSVEDLVFVRDYFKKRAEIRRKRKSKSSIRIGRTIAAIPRLPRRSGTFPFIRTTRTFRKRTISITISSKNATAAGRINILV